MTNQQIKLNILKTYAFDYVKDLKTAECAADIADGEQSCSKCPSKFCSYYSNEYLAEFDNIYKKKALPLIKNFLNKSQSEVKEFLEKNYPEQLL